MIHFIFEMENLLFIVRFNQSVFQLFLNVMNILQTDSNEWQREMTKKKLFCKHRAYKYEWRMTTIVYVYWMDMILWLSTNFDTMWFRTAEVYINHICYRKRIKSSSTEIEVNCIHAYAHTFIWAERARDRNKWKKIKNKINRVIAGR